MTSRKKPGPGGTYVSHSCQAPYFNNGKFLTCNFSDSNNNFPDFSIWVLNSFSDYRTHHCDALMELQANYSQKATFNSFVSSLDFWVSRLAIPKHKELAEKVIATFVPLTTAYSCKQGFSNWFLLRQNRGIAFATLTV